MQPLDYYYITCLSYTRDLITKELKHEPYPRESQDAVRQNMKQRKEFQAEGTIYAKANR